MHSRLVENSNLQNQRNTSATEGPEKRQKLRSTHASDQAISPPARVILRIIRVLLVGLAAELLAQVRFSFLIRRPKPLKMAYVSLRRLTPKTALYSLTKSARRPFRAKPRQGEPFR